MARSRSSGRSAVGLRWAGVAVLALVGLLYYRPLRAYVDARHQLAARHADVRSLEIRNARLERRLAASATVATLEREARRLGYVKPGQHLYIVQGIDAWRARLRSSLRRHG